MYPTGRVGYLAAVVGAVLLAVSACGSTSTSSAGNAATGAPAACSSPGVSASTIKLGAITTLSGPQSVAFAPFAAGWNARIDEQNAAGGVNGRKIDITTVDDGGLVPQSVTAAQQLILRDQVFGVLASEPVMSGDAPLLSSQGVPVVGYNVNPEWGKLNNMFGFNGGYGVSSAVTTTIGSFLKSQGVKKLAIVGTNNPSVVAAADANEASFKSVGGDVVLLSTSAPVTNSIWLPQAQQVKASGADGLYLPIITPQAVALLSELAQLGVRPKVAVLPQGYGPATLKQLGSAANGLTFAVTWVPFEAATTGDGHQQALDALAKYASGQPVTEILVDGYLAGNLMIQGLELAGSCPTRQAFISKVRGLTDYTANGFFNPAVNFTSTFGQPFGLCFHFVTVKDGRFVPDTGSQATCGKVVG
jgi:branched-chain amino acid transport system substrate-binding protein